MQKVSIMKNTIFGTCLALALFGNSYALNVDDDALKNCQSVTARLDRLFCYDELLGTKIMGVNTSPVDPTSPMTADAKRAFHLAASKERSDKDIALALYKSNTMDVWEEYDAPLFGYLEGLNETDVEDLKQKADLWLALESREDTGVKSVLALSCQTNITNFEIYLQTPLPTGYNKVRFISSNISRNSSRDVELRVRTISKGYKLQMPRGLEGIRLIGQLLNDDVLQMSFHNGDEIQSAFFDTNKLNTVIKHLGRHCDWAN